MRMMKMKVTVLVKHLLVVSILMLLENQVGNGAPAKRCFRMKTPEHEGAAFQRLRSKYDDLRIREVEPWKNCSGKHLQLPKLGKLGKLMAWEKLEAMEMQLDLFIPVLLNQSEANFTKDAFQVLDFLIPFRRDLKACIRHKPSQCQDSGQLKEFTAQLQRFNTSNTEQSPKCLEAAVGLNLYKLLQDIKNHFLHEDNHYYHHHHHHHHHQQRHTSSN